MWIADVTITKARVITCHKEGSVRWQRNVKQSQNTHSSEEESEERRIVPSADAVINPLTMVVTPIHAIIALRQTFINTFL